MRLLLTALVSFLSFPVLACQCPETVTEMNLEKYNHYDLIVSGVVDSVSSCTHSQTIYFSVTTSYKGNVTDRIQLTGNDCNSSCGLHVESGKSYILYALQNEDKTYTLPHCSPSHSILTDAEIKVEEEKLENNATGIQTFSHDLEIWQQEKEVLEKLLKTDGYLHITYLNGKRTAHGKMEKGMPIGKWIYYFPDGRIDATGHYVNGKKEGAWTEFVYVTSDYTDATQHISTQLVHMYGTYANGLKEGKWHKINPDGTIHTYYYKAGHYVNQVD